MKVPSHLYQHLLTDADTEAFFLVFDEVPCRVLEVGAHDEPVANILTDLDFKVTGVDLREYHAGQDVKDSESPPCNYEYIRADFCDLSPYFHKKWLEYFDVAISLSAIEHFGFGTYGEGHPSYFYDVIAMRRIWECLKVGGVAYITVPFGKRYQDVFPDWRIYNSMSVGERLVQDFQSEFVGVFISGPVEINGEKRDKGAPITMEEANNYDGDDPHISIILKLRKTKINRLAPDGR